MSYFFFFSHEPLLNVTAAKCLKMSDLFFLSVTVMVSINVVKQRV